LTEEDWPLLTMLNSRVLFIAAIIVILVGVLALAKGPEFAFVPPQPAAWAPPPGYEGKNLVWAPPEGFVVPDKPWDPPKGWGEPEKWAPPEKF
jgi:hypothetical protein